MITIYLRIAFRNLIRQKGHTFINITGLSIGIVCCILIILYIQDEINFDSFHKKADQIYRIIEIRNTPDQGNKFVAQTVGPLGPALVENLPEVEESVRLIQLWRLTVSYGDNRFYEGDYLLTEPSFFRIFDFELLKGDPAIALNSPRSVVLTSRAAHKYFGNEDPMGKTLSVEALGDVLVTGVLDDIPLNSHLNFSMLFSFESMSENFTWWDAYLSNWDPNYRSMITYVVLNSVKSNEEMAGKAKNLLEKYREDSDWPVRSLVFQPLKNIHFHSSNLEFDRNAHKSDFSFIYIFSTIAFCIILIACLNYMNLATARAVGRAKEIGIRKVSGANRWKLFCQFVGESIFISFWALLFAVVLAELFLPTFNEIASKNLSLDLQNSPPIAFGLFLLVLLVGVFAGSYPALFLSRIQPISIFRGVSPSGNSNFKIRKMLVVSQFALAIILIVTTLIVSDQLNFIRNKKLGYDQDHLIAIDINNMDVRRNFKSIKAEMLQNPRVKSVAVSSRIPGDWKTINQIEVIPEGDAQTNRRTMYFMSIDQDFLPTFQMSLLKGNNFSGDRISDSTSVIINETAARILGINNLLEKQIMIPKAGLEGGGVEKTNYRFTIRGVVKDFHFQSLREEIAPLVLGFHNNPIQSIDYFSGRISGTDLPGTINSLREIGERFDPTHPFEYNFLDQRIEDVYQSEKRLGNIFKISASLAILIACMGLFGLVAFITEQRTKEIGIRKVLGASVSDILLLLIKEFSILIIFASLIATPVAWAAMNWWLRDFAYRISIGIDLFILAGVLTLVIAVITVSYQAVRAAIKNPVEALRYE